MSYAAKSLPDSETLRVPDLPPLSGQAVYLGLIDYQAAWQLQLDLVAARSDDRIGDTLILCQHPDVVTVGRRQAAQQNILDARFPLFEVERGGDVTYHGPGQLVGYPILKLRPAPPSESGDSSRAFGERDLHRYLRALEGALIDLCADYGVQTARKAGATGVWTADGAHKLASLGIAVRRWVTFHGFALNIDTDLSRFSAINPCGFSAQVMTSLAACAPSENLHVEAVLEPAIAHLGQRLSRHFTQVAPSAISLPPAE